MKDIYNEFKNYVYNNYDINKKKIIFKYYHTLRVVDVATQIANSIKMNDVDIRLAETCAILHDIARFRQATQYDTFEDSLSFDHGDMGEVILRENDYIEKYLDNSLDKELVIKTVRNHNKYALEEGLSEKEILFCNIVRDADKVDILVNQGDFPLDNNQKSINSKIFSAFKNHILIDNKDVNNNVEATLREIALIFDLNFEESFKIIKEKELIDKLFNYIRRSYTGKDLDEIYLIVEEYINSKTRKKTK